MSKKPAPKPAAKSPAHKAAATRAKKRAAPTEAVPAASQGRRDLSVRKIANGYVVRESTSHRGKYVERETFTPTAPKISIANAPKGKP